MRQELWRVPRCFYTARKMIPVWKIVIIFKNFSMEVLKSWYLPFISSCLTRHTEEQVPGMVNGSALGQHSCKRCGPGTAVMWKVVFLDQITELKQTPILVPVRILRGNEYRDFMVPGWKLFLATDHLYYYTEREQKATSQL